MAGFRFLVVLVLIAMGTASVADARGRHHRHHHRGDGFDLGDAIIGAAVLGGIIAVANAGKKNRDERRADPPAPPAPYPPQSDPWDNDARGDDNDWRGDSDWSYADPDYQRRFPSERAAVEACAGEAEALGGRYGADARVDRIFDVYRAGPELQVTGRVRIDDRRSGDVEDANFTCFADGGEVTGFRFEEQVAYRD